MAEFDLPDGIQKIKRSPIHLLLSQPLLDFSTLKLIPTTLDPATTPLSKSNVFWKCGTHNKRNNIPMKIALKVRKKTGQTTHPIHSHPPHLHLHRFLDGSISSLRWPILLIHEDALADFQPHHLWVQWLAALQHTGGEHGRHHGTRWIPRGHVFEAPKWRGKKNGRLVLETLRILEFCCNRRGECWIIFPKTVTSCYPPLIRRLPPWHFSVAPCFLPYAKLEPSTETRS